MSHKNPVLTEKIKKQERKTKKQTRNSTKIKDKKNIRMNRQSDGEIDRHKKIKINAASNRDKPGFCFGSTVRKSL